MGHCPTRLHTSKKCGTAQRARTQIRAASSTRYDPLQACMSHATSEPCFQPPPLSSSPGRLLCR
eukprot:311122-Chlamydomonas_euryale.AAC.1